MKRICQLISKYMRVLVLLSAVIGPVFPDLFSHIKPKVINPLLGVIMFGMTGVSTLLAPILTPLLVLLLAGQSVDVDVVARYLSNNQ